MWETLELVHPLLVLILLVLRWCFKTALLVFVYRRGQEGDTLSAHRIREHTNCARNRKFTGPVNARLSSVKRRSLLRCLDCREKSSASAKTWNCLYNSLLGEEHFPTCARLSTADGYTSAGLQNRSDQKKNNSSLKNTEGAFNFFKNECMIIPLKVGRRSPYLNSVWELLWNLLLSTGPNRQFPPSKHSNIIRVVC